MMSSSTTIALLYTLCLHFFVFPVCFGSSLLYAFHPSEQFFSLLRHYGCLLSYCHFYDVLFFFPLCFLFYLQKYSIFFSNSTLASYLCVLQVFLWNVFRKYVLQFLLPTPTPTVSLKQQFLLQPSPVVNVVIVRIFCSIHALSLALLTFLQTLKRSFLISYSQIHQFQCYKAKRPLQLFYVILSWLLFKGSHPVFLFLLL